MAREGLSKVKTGANAVVFVVAIIVAIVFANVITNRYFKRADFTHDHIYTLSQPSKDLVKHLPDRLTVKAFISGDLQPPFSEVGQYVRDLLAEYAASSGGKLKWEAIDPASDPKLEQEAEKLKVPKMQRGRVSSNKVVIGASYLGIAFEYEGKIESIPEINSPEGLEFQIDSIIKLLTQKKKKVAFATSEGELSLENTGGPHGGLQLVKQYLRDYDVVPVQLNQGDKPIPDDVDALVIAGPKSPMTERSKFVVDQFLMRGKAVAFLVDGMVIDSGSQMQMPGRNQPKIGRKNNTGLDDLLGSYGFTVKDDVVLDARQNVPGPIEVNGQLFLANYPTFLVSTNLDDKSPIMDHVQALILPFASSVEVTSGKQPGLTYTKLARSSPNSWRQSGFFLFDPQNADLKVGTDKGPFVLAWSARGKLKSFFAGKPYPNAKGEKVNPPGANESVAPGPNGEEAKPLDESVGTPRLLVVGDSQFTSDDYLRFARSIPTYASNLLFTMNSIDWLVQDDALSAIRAKGVQSRPLTYASDATPTVVKYANIIGVPLAFILFGLVRWRLRSARRRAARV